MTTRWRTQLLLPVLLLGVACSQEAPLSPSSVRGSAAAPLLSGADEAGLLARSDTPLTATIQFGQPNVGSPFPPTSGHDQSAHAKDNLVPRTVVIGQGGTVTFNTFGVHQVSIYGPGKEAEDINTGVLTAAPSGCPGVPLINDGTNRVATIWRPCSMSPRTLTHTFTQPGRYLVICAFLPHFNVGMYGWVIVK